jgi:hypothetical protein
LEHLVCYCLVRKAHLHLLERAVAWFQAVDSQVAVGQQVVWSDLHQQEFVTQEGVAAGLWQVDLECLHRECCQALNLEAPLQQERALGWHHWFLALGLENQGCYLWRWAKWLQQQDLVSHCLEEVDCLH